MNIKKCDNEDCKAIINKGDIISHFEIEQSDMNRYYSDRFEFCGKCTGRVARLIGSRFKFRFIQEMKCK